jgi:hypothetical protein
MVKEPLPDVTDESGKHDRQKIAAPGRKLPDGRR